MNGNDIIEYIERNYDRLVDIGKQRGLFPEGITDNVIDENVLNELATELMSYGG